MLLLKPKFMGVNNLMFFRCFVTIFGILIGTSTAYAEFGNTTCSGFTFKILDEKQLGATLGILSMHGRYSVSNGDNICLGGSYKGTKRLYRYRCSDGEWEFVKTVTKSSANCSSDGTIEMRAYSTGKIVKQVNTMQVDMLCSRKSDEETEAEYHKRLFECDKKYYRFSYSLVELR